MAVVAAVALGAAGVVAVRTPIATPAFASGRVDLVTTTTAPKPAGPAPAVPALTGPFTVARATGTPIDVYSSPGAASAVRTLPAIGIVDKLQVFLVKHQVDANWLEVYLPTRPNQSTGFIHTSTVTLSQTNVQIKVETALHRLTAWDGTQVIAQEPVVVGAHNMPTPLGTYFLQGFVYTGNPRGAYGPYIFALSAHSDVFQYFAGGDGLVGLHGTNQPQLRGQSVSHGCVRVSNDAITHFTDIFPPGAPFVVVP